MEHIDKKIEEYAKIVSNDTIRGLLISMMRKNTNIFPSGEDYYYLTDLCDPVKKYLEKYPDIVKFDSESEKSKIMGNKIHKIATIWIQNMENFVSSESKLDGMIVGAKVIGKIDAKIGESILDFKSKKCLPESIDDIIKLCAYDLEQIAFYSVIDPLKPSINYLVFISQKADQEMKVFRIVIKDHSSILKILLQRINNLDAVKRGYKPEEVLGKCRFCDKDKCPFLKLNLCKWVNNTFECEVLDFIEIKEDKKYKEKLLIARSKWDNNTGLFTPNEIISARKTLYNNSVEKIEDGWDEDIEKTLAKIYSQHIAFLVKTNYNEKIKEYPKPKITEIQNHRSWFNIKDAKNQQGIILPYVTGASLSKNEWYLKHIPSYKLSEIAVICAAYGISKGFIIEYLPNLNIKFRAYEVNFEELEKVIKEVNKRIAILKQNKIKNFEELLLCPDFFCKECNIKEFCEKNSN